MRPMFLFGTGSMTIAPGVSSLTIEAVAGGGGGAGTASAVVPGSAGGGGSSGAYRKVVFDVLPSDPTLSWSCGTGGVGGDTIAVAGADGQSTTIKVSGVTEVIPGGKGGGAPTVSADGVSSYAPGGGLSLFFSFILGPTVQGLGKPGTNNAGYSYGGCGGGTPMGSGGAGGGAIVGPQDGGIGQGWGGGGGGGHATTGIPKAGGFGQPGCLFVVFNP